MKHKSKGKSHTTPVKVKQLVATKTRTQVLHDATIQEFADYEMDLWYRLWIKNQVLIVTVLVLTVVALLGYVSNGRYGLLSANVLDASVQDQVSSLDQQDMQDNLPIEDPMQFHQ